MVPVVLQGTCLNQIFRDLVSLSCWGTLFENNHFPFALKIYDRSTPHSTGKSHAFASAFLIVKDFH